MSITAAMVVYTFFSVTFHSRTIWTSNLSSLFKIRLNNTILENVLMTIKIILPQVQTLFHAFSYDVLYLLLLLLWPPRVSLVIFAVTILILLLKKNDDAHIKFSPSTNNTFKEVNVLKKLEMASNSFTLIVFIPVSQGPRINP